MADTTVKKIDSRHSPKGEMGQWYLASGKQVGMRLWEEEPREPDPPTSREYETVGFVISGKAELIVDSQKVLLEPGDSWLVPPGALHQYRVLEPFSAVEATAPPSLAHGRDETPEE